jgi:hypothetical protein
MVIPPYCYGTGCAKRVWFLLYTDKRVQANIGRLYDGGRKNKKIKETYCQNMDTYAIINPVVKGMTWGYSSVG